MLFYINYFFNVYFKWLLIFLIKFVGQIQSSYPLTDKDDLSDDVEGRCVKDSILFISIQKGWSHAPRFIKVGQYLVLFHSIL